MRYWKKSSEQVKTMSGSVELLLSYVPSEGTPKPFYQKSDIVEAGVVEASEIITSLRLQ